MGAKRALIVDDSKSARLFLARALRKIRHRRRQRRDRGSGHRVPGHSAPGCDLHGSPDARHGWPAGRAGIKNDPRTATIPIMMYTSQEGELYLGQARALGAIGVLPKQIKPTDVSKVLYQLHLVPDRRNREQTTFTPLNRARRGGQRRRRRRRAPRRSPTARCASTSPSCAARWSQAWIHRRTASPARCARCCCEMLPSAGPAGRAPARALGLDRRLRRTGDCPHQQLRCGGAACALLEDLSAQVSELRAHESPLAAALPVPVTAPVAHAPAAAAGGRVRPAPRCGRSVIPVPYGADTFGGRALRAHPPVPDPPRASESDRGGRGAHLRRPFLPGGQRGGGLLAGPRGDRLLQVRPGGQPFRGGSSATQRTPLTLANLIGEIRSSTHGALDVQLASGRSGEPRDGLPDATSRTHRR